MGLGIKNSVKAIYFRAPQSHVYVELVMNLHNVFFLKQIKKKPTQNNHSSDEPKTRNHLGGPTCMWAVFQEQACAPSQVNSRSQPSSAAKSRGLHPFPEFRPSFPMAIRRLGSSMVIVRL
jgi:hypothetical protein